MGIGILNVVLRTIDRHAIDAEPLVVPRLRLDAQERPSTDNPPLTGTRYR